MVLYLRLSRLQDVMEVRARVLPVGVVYFSCLTDLDKDGNDEILVRVRPEGWMNFSKRSNETVIAVTMRNGKFVTYRIPLPDSAMYWLRAPERGQWFVCLTRKGELIVFERTPDGKWQESSLKSKATNEFFVCDFDGNELEDDVVVVTAERQFLWFQRLPDGQFQKRGEVTIPMTGRIYPVVSNCVASWGVWTGKSYQSLPIFLWEGKLRVGQIDEQVAIFNGDWFGSGKKSKLLVRFFTGYDKVRWQFEHSGLKGTLNFKGWKLAKAEATNKLGDGKWHLLVTMAKPKPLTVRVVDCSFEPLRGWQVSEIGRWEVKGRGGLSPPTSFSHFSQWLDELSLTFGDADGDGRNEIVVGDSWLLYRLGHRWRVLLLVTFKNQTATSWIVNKFSPMVAKNGRLWFIRTVSNQTKTPYGFSSETEPLRELGTFNAKGKWQPLGKFRQSSAWGQKIDDLNGDCSPELLAFEGLIWQKPVLYYRSIKGQWRKKRFVGGSLGRLLEVWLRGTIDAFPEPRAVHLVQWEGKKWFVILWGDSFVQAVTLRR